MKSKLFRIKRGMRDKVKMGYNSVQDLLMALNMKFYDGGGLHDLIVLV